MEKGRPFMPGDSEHAANLVTGKLSATETDNSMGSYLPFKLAQGNRDSDIVTGHYTECSTLPLTEPGRSSGCFLLLEAH